MEIKRSKTLGFLPAGSNAVSASTSGRTRMELLSSADFDLAPWKEPSSCGGTPHPGGMSPHSLSHSLALAQICV